LENEDDELDNDILALKGEESNLTEPNALEEQDDVKNVELS